MIKKEQGFTLIEVVIVIGIFSMLMLGLMNLFDWHNKVFFLERAEIEATGSARIAMNNISEYVAQTIQIQTSRTISGTTYTTGSTTMVLQLPAYDSSDNLLTGVYDYIVYYVSGNSLYQRIEPGAGSSRSTSTKIMTAYVQSVSFTYNNADVTAASQVIVDLQTQATIRGTKKASTHVANTIFLRNH